VQGVSVRDLYKTFGSVVAVDHVSFELQAGSFLTLLGPSGCGKTTTLRCVAGLEKPDGGSIRVGERLLTSIEEGVQVPPEKRGMGMVFQSYAIWPHMTVFQNVAFPVEEQRLPRREIRERVMAILATVGLDGLHERPAPHLSGGQQQRVALARALVSNPDVLLLDEPLSNLDARLREEMRFELREMQARLGISTIFVTHDQLEAITLSDHVIVMQGGRIEQQGTPRQVYASPRTPFVMDFLGHVNHLPARVVRAAGGEYAALVAEGGRDLLMPLPRQDGWEEGSEVVLAFRAEAGQVSGASDGAQLAGVVAAAVYMGSHVDYQVQVGDRRVRVPGPVDEQFPLGARVHLTVPPGAIHAWPKETAAGAVGLASPSTNGARG
jgi:iron(III) transport system ATP-binding protein